MLSETEAVAASERAIEGKISPRPGAEVSASLDGGRWTVTWVVPGEASRRGPDFEARVTVDAESGDVVEVLAGS